MKYGYLIAIIAFLLLGTVLWKDIAVAQELEVATDAATDVISDSATLNGTLNSLGNYSWADVSFEWGGDAFYGNETPLGNMSTTGPFSDSIVSLSPNTTYHFRAKALGNGTDLLYGNDATFTTGIPPAVTTNTANNVIGDSATLNGNLTSLGNALSVNVSFEWGLTISYSSETTPQIMTATGLFSGNLSSLIPGTTYHFRAKAMGNGTLYGDDMTFIAGALNLQGWGWCTNYNQVVAITFDGYTTMVDRANAPNTYSMHVVGNLILPAPYNETIPLDMYGNRVRLVFYLRQEVTGKSVDFEGTWIDNSTGNGTYIGMAGRVALPNPESEVLKTGRICFVLLRTPNVQVPLTDSGSFTEDLDSMLTRFVKFIDTTLDTLVGSGFAGILSEILQRIAVLLAHIRALGIPYIT